MALPAVVPRSDGECELGEGSREPMPGSDVGSKFVVAAVQVHLGRSRSLLKCLGEEPTGGRQIPFLCGEDIDDLAELIDRPVQIDPPTRDFDAM